MGAVSGVGGAGRGGERGDLRGQTPWLASRQLLPPARRGKRGLASQARAGLEAGVRAEATAEITRLTCLLAGQVAGQVSAGDSGGLEVV